MPHKVIKTPKTRNEVNSIIQDRFARKGKRHGMYGMKKDWFSISSPLYRQNYDNINWGSPNAD